MLRIVVELVPHGDVRRAEVIATGWIANDGSGETHIADYYGEFRALERTRGAKLAPPFYPTQKRSWTTRHASTHGFPRTKRGIWELVARMLDSCVHERTESATADDAVARAATNQHELTTRA